LLGMAVETPGKAGIGGRIRRWLRGG
jgi:hypothetical protein